MNTLADLNLCWEHLSKGMFLDVALLYGRFCQSNWGFSPFILISKKYQDLYTYPDWCGLLYDIFLLWRWMFWYRHSLYKRFCQSHWWFLFFLLFFDLFLHFLSSLFNFSSVIGSRQCGSFVFLILPQIDYCIN